MGFVFVRDTSTGKIKQAYGLVPDEILYKLNRVVEKEFDEDGNVMGTYYSSHLGTTDFDDNEVRKRWGLPLLGQHHDPKTCEHFWVLKSEPNKDTVNCCTKCKEEREYLKGTPPLRLNS